MSGETLTLPFEIKWLTESEQPGTFEGVASSYGNRDHGGDIMAPGAFAGSLAEHKVKGTKPALLWGHDLSKPIGVIDAINEDHNGLHVKGRLALDTAAGRDAHALGKMGALGGMSVGYKTKNATRDGKGTRTITQAHLYEVSLVTLPMNERAQITGLKGIRKMEIEELEAKIVDLEGKAAKIADLEAKAAKVETLEADLKAARADTAKATKRTDDIELKMNRPGAQQQLDETKELEKKAFAGFVRGNKLGPYEYKALRTADDTAGGYLAPDQFIAELIRNLVQFSPIRSLARVGSTNSGAVILPKRTARLSGYWVGETENRTETFPVYGQIEIPIAEAACYVDVSNQLLEDSALDIAAELARDLAEEFGRLEGQAFVSGTGVKQPMGIMSDLTVPSAASGSTTFPLTTASSDAMSSLLYSLPPFYRNRSSWLMNGSTIAQVRQIKDAQGHYVWQEGIAGGQPSTLLSRPVVEAVDMPNIAAGAAPIAVGDFNSAYRIYDRLGLSILRDPYSVQMQGKVRFHARRRVGGALVLSEGVRKLRIAVS